MNGPSDTAVAADPAAPERFDELIGRLRALVERLEGGHLALEDGLRCFEEGMALCKRGAEILDKAERRVEVLLDTGKGKGKGESGPRTAPFDDTTPTRDEQSRAKE